MLFRSRFIAENEARVDRNQEAYFPSINCNRWLAVRLEFLGSIIILSTATLAVFTLVRSRNIDAGIVGLMLSCKRVSQSLFEAELTPFLRRCSSSSFSSRLRSLESSSLTSTLPEHYADPQLGRYVLSSSPPRSGTDHFPVRSATEVETNIVSVERVQEYIELKPEAPLSIPETQPGADWPTEGSLTYSHVSARYRENLDLVLRDVSFHLKGGEKVGVCGRTGAGKSSLTMVGLGSLEVEWELMLSCSFCTALSRPSLGRSSLTASISARLASTACALACRSSRRIRSASKVRCRVFSFSTSC